MNTAITDSSSVGLGGSLVVGFGRMLAHGVGSLFFRLANLVKGRPVEMDSHIVRPRGTEPSQGGDLGQLKKARPIKLSSRENFLKLPMLDPSQARDVAKYQTCANLSFHPGDEENEEDQVERMRSAGVEDFFQTGLAGEDLVKAVGKGKIDGVPTRIVDPSTGFVASITYDKNSKEVIVGFSGLGSDANGQSVWGQIRSLIANWLGFVPQSFKQGAELVRLGEKRVQELNKQIPEGQQKLKVTIAGFSMGGAVGTYAALKTGVPAIVMNPAHIGLGCRINIGPQRLAEAHKYVTEVVVPGDWVSDNRAANLYKFNPLNPFGLVFNSTGEIGTARRFLLPPSSEDHTPKTRHVSVLGYLQPFEEGHESRSVFFPHLGEYLDGKLSEQDRLRMAKDPETMVKTALRNHFKEQRIAGGSDFAEKYANVLKSFGSQSEHEVDIAEIREKPTVYAVGSIVSLFEKLAAVKQLRADLRELRTGADEPALEESELLKALDQDLEHMEGVLESRISKIVEVVKKTVDQQTAGQILSGAKEVLENYRYEDPKNLLGI